jgi:hypothetical protein
MALLLEMLFVFCQLALADMGEAVVLITPPSGFSNVS